MDTASKKLHWKSSEKNEDLHTFLRRGGCCGGTGTPPVINNFLLIRVIERVKSWKNCTFRTICVFLKHFIQVAPQECGVPLVFASNHLKFNRKNEKNVTTPTIFDRFWSGLFYIVCFNDPQQMLGTHFWFLIFKIFWGGKNSKNHTKKSKKCKNAFNFWPILLGFVLKGLF